MYKYFVVYTIKKRNSITIGNCTAVLKERIKSIKEIMEIEQGIAKENDIDNECAVCLMNYKEMKEEKQ